MTRAPAARLLMALLAAAAAACGSPAAKSDAAGDTGAGIDARAARWVAYVGGYGGNIEWYSVDPSSGQLAKLGSVAQVGASFLAWDDSATHLYAVDETNSRVVAYAIDAGGALTKLNDQSSGGSGPAHLAVSQGHVLVANYGDGKVAVLPIAADGSVMPATQTLSAGAHAHEVVVNGGYAFVPCLGADDVAQYTWDGTTLTPNGQMMTAVGAGPRHLAFATGTAFLVDETASTLMNLAYHDGQLSPLGTISTLPAGFTGTNTGAEVATFNDWVWVSNRGADDIATFAVVTDGIVTLTGHDSTLGTTPRHFSLSPDHHFMLVANQGSGGVHEFVVENGDGRPVDMGVGIAVDQPSFVGIAALP